MSRLWFVVPAAGRESLTRVCLRQLRRTCDALAGHGIEASAVVVADDRNLRTAENLGFATVIRDNWSTSKKFNDGIMFACDDRYNHGPVDYVVPCGSDDWVDYRLFLDLPPKDTMLCFQRAAFVNETATKMVSCELSYPGGVGIRVIPRELVARGGKDWDPHRPAAEDRKRGCDTSIWVNIGRTFPQGSPRFRYVHLHDFQVVDWKSKEDQLNTFDDVIRRHRRGLKGPFDPFEALADTYPAEALNEMRLHYRHMRTRVAA